MKMKRKKLSTINSSVPEKPGVLELVRFWVKRRPGEDQG